MDFRLDSTHTDLSDTVMAIVVRAGGVAVARAWSQGDRSLGLDVYRQLAAAGIPGLLVDDDLGGSGAGAVEAVVALEALGRYALPGPAAETLVVLPAVLAGAGLAVPLAPLLTGERLATCAAPPTTPRAADAEGADVYLIDGASLYRGTTREGFATVDPTRTISAVERGELLTDDAIVCVATDLGALATAAYSLGLAATMLQIGAEYATARHQFGRAIGSFQAVKHHLADVAIAVEMARPLVWGAAVGADSDDSDASTVERDISAAKVAACQAADLAARNCLQVLGAIGYTAEHDLSLFLTKARALRSAWGTPDWHRARILESL